MSTYSAPDRLGLPCPDARPRLLVPHAVGCLWCNIDAFTPGLAVTLAGRRSPVAPDHRVVRLGLGVAVALHVGQVQAAARAQPLLGEPRETRPEVGAAASLDRGPLRQIAGGVKGRILDGGIDLEKRDGLGLQFRRDLPDLGPEQGQRVGRQRAGGVR